MSASASASGSASASASAHAERMTLYGIDPGPVNTGLCEYDATHGRVRSLERVQFRESGAGHDDLGSARLISQVTAWINKNVGRFTDSLIFIENQPPESYGQEGQAIQHTFQALFGDRCIPVNPASYKARYGEYFPRHPMYDTFPLHRRAANQKEYDRKNAILSGKQFVPEAIRREYEQKNPKKHDDAYEAYWIARFGNDFMFGDDGKLLDKPKPPTRRKRSEGPHPRGRPSPKAKAKAKANPKAKGVAKPKPKSRPMAKAKSARTKKVTAKGKAEADPDYDEDEDDLLSLDISAATSQ